jgi:hypothetical protein
LPEAAWLAIVVTVVFDTRVAFVAAVAAPKDPTVNAAVVMTTAKTFFFDDICMPPVPC